MPVVTVGITCYNEGDLLLEALESLFAQSMKDWECIIVNDASNHEQTNEICRQIEEQADPRVRVIWSAENGGLAAARNQAVRAAQTDLYVVLDADDLLPTTALDHIVKTFSSNPEAGFVYGCYCAFGDWQYEHRPPAQLQPSDFVDGLPFTGATPFRISTWKAVGGYPIPLSYGMQDWGFWLGVVSQGISGAFVDEQIYLYRAREGTMSRRRARRFPSIYSYLYETYPEFLDQYGPGQAFIARGYSRGAKAVYFQGDDHTARSWAWRAATSGDCSLQNLRILLMTTLALPLRRLRRGTTT